MTWLSDDLADMQETQEASMLDTCDILTYTAGAINEYGKPAPASWVSSGIPTECGFGYMQSIGGVSSYEAPDQVATMRTVLRLPLDSVVTRKDRIELTRRFGSDITPEYYHILGEIRRGPTCLTCDLALVTDGSNAG